MSKKIDEIIKKHLGENVAHYELSVFLKPMFDSLPNGDPLKLQYDKYIKAFSDIASKDKKTVKNAIKEINNFYKYLLSPQADGRSGHEILSEKLNDNQKENFNMRLHNTKYELGLDVDLTNIPNDFFVKDQVKKTPDRPMRKAELEDYFYRLTTTKQKLDFVAGILATQFSDDPPLVYDEEVDHLLNIFSSHFVPWDKKIKHVNAKKSKDRLDDLNHVYLESLYDLGKAYHDKLNNEYSGEDKEQASVKAATDVTSASAEIDMYNLIFRNEFSNAILDLSAKVEFFDADTNQPVDFNASDYLASSRKKLNSDISKYSYNDRECELFNDGKQLCNPHESKFLEPLNRRIKKVGLDNAYKEFGIDPQKLFEDRTQLQKGLIEKADMNWTKDETFWDAPVFYDPRNTSDYRNYFTKNFRALDDAKSRIKYLCDAALVKRRKLKGLTANETEALDTCTAELFSHVTDKGEPDYISFKNTLKEYAVFMAEKDITIGEEATSNRAKKLVGSNDPAMLRRAVIYTSDAALEKRALKEQIENVVKKGSLNRQFMKRFIKENGLKVPKSGEDLDKLPDRFLEAVEKYNSVVADKLCDELNDDQINCINFVKRSPHEAELSGETEKRLKADRDKRYVEKTDAMFKNLRKGPEIDMDALLSLSNLYDQLKNEDHWYHWNSFEYNELCGYLKKVDAIYRKYGPDDDEITEKDKEILEGLYHNIGHYSSEYLKDKVLKRSTDLGQQRYEIVLSIMEQVDHGDAKRIMKAHAISNYTAERHFKEMGWNLSPAEKRKELTIDDLHERSGKRYASRRNRTSSTDMSMDDIQVSGMGYDTMES